jgi:hypothetical protein
MLSNPGVQAGIVAADFFLLGVVLWNLVRVARRSKRNQQPTDSEFAE